MNSRQRVLATLEGKIPDRVPWGEFAVDFDTAEKILGHETYLRAKAKSQVAFWNGRHDEVAESYLKDHIALHRKLDLDIITFPQATWEIPLESDDPPPRRVDPSTWEDKYGRVYKYSSLTEDITCIQDPVEKGKEFGLEDFLRDPAASARDERSWKILDGVIREFKGEKFICSPSGGIVGTVLPGGLEKGSLALAHNPELIIAATSFCLREQNLADEQRVHPGADAVLVAHDFGHKTGPFIGPSMFRTFFLEANAARVRRLHREYDKKVILHSCGNVNAYLDFFIEIGFDAYQSIQGSAGMDLRAVKEKCGDRIALWGGVSVENLVGGTPQDVREDVRQAMEWAKPGGRFILGTSHSIAVGSRFDNVMAMIDEYHRLASY
ncbi:MAG: uroporphyrinogen decarboxylase family protein [Acidobacteriota bacterium]